MKNGSVYLDFNATAPAHDAVMEAVLHALRLSGNPSSVHSYGREARKCMEDARAVVADSLGVKPAQVIFTSGGTEANALALTQVQNRLVSAIEHPSAVVYAQEGRVICARPDGRIDIQDLQEKLSAAELVCVMAANNETGVIQPIREIRDLCQAQDARLHVDAVQAFGRIDFRFDDWGADSIALSAHKIGGPKGVGALVIRDGLPITPHMLGGGQEVRRRGGTENLPGIAGFAAAVKAMQALGPWQARAAALRDQMEANICAIAPDAVIFGANAPRICNTSAIAMPGVKAETQLMAFDLAGIAVSAGSACSSGKVAASPVLKAMGASDDLSASTIRVSLGWTTSEEDIARFIAAWSALYQRTRQAA